MSNSALGAGDAGGITLTAPSILLQNGGFVRGIATDRGNAGTFGGELRPRGLNLDLVGIVPPWERVGPWVVVGVVEAGRREHPCCRVPVVHRIAEALVVWSAALIARSASDQITSTSSRSREPIQR